MVYTGIVFYDPDVKCTPRQLGKMVEAITRPQPDPDGLVAGLRLMYTTPLKIHGRVGRLYGDPLMKFRYSESRRAPYMTRTLPEVEAVSSSVEYLIQRPIWTSSWWDMIYPTLEGVSNRVERFIEVYMQEELKSGPPDMTEMPWMGVIALIPEPGLKLRFAANPGRVYQSLTGPLGRKLFGALRQLPNDFTYDQSAGLRFVQKRLAEGLPAVSMDLSNATDRFPLELELAFLANNGVEPKWLNLLRDLSRGDWTYQVGKDKSAPVSWIRWTVGSPLGVFPTFAAFALGHHALVQALFAELGLQPREDGFDYAIVGDDVVIFNREVADLYRKVMDGLGVLISESKTLDADHVGEFLGRLITPDEVYQGFKWKGRCSDESFLDLARNLGPASLVLMRKRQRDVVRLLGPVPEPIGLGWNPNGRSWSERVGPWFDELLEDKDERVRSFESSRSHSFRLLYQDPTLLWNEKSEDWRVQGELLTSDQDVIGLYPTFLPGWSGDQWGVEVWPNILESALFRDVDPETDERFAAFLRYHTTFERRKDVPMLVQLERKIRRVLSSGK
jgi:hypothetical protein